MPDERVVILSASVLPWQRDAIEDFWHRERLASFSEALRRVITEWHNNDQANFAAEQVVRVQEQPA